MTERFPPEVAEVLAEAGWFEGRQVPDVEDTVAGICRTVSAKGRRHIPVTAATDALREFGGLWIEQDAPGRDLLRRSFGLDPAPMAASVDTLDDFGAVVHSTLFPIGAEGALDSILAMDEHGRVFAIDHAGEWFLGNSIDEALIALIEGHRVPRVDEHGAY